MNRAAFASFGGSAQTSKVSKRPVRREVREDGESDENQVVPFHLDDGADDNEEIRRRRYSSNYSSVEDDDDRRGARRRVMCSQRENDWDKASSQEASAACEEDDLDSDDEAEPVAGKHRQDEPESPRKARRNSQQSDDGEEDDDDDVEAKPTRATTSSIGSPIDLSVLSKLGVWPGSETELVQGHVLRVKTLLGSQYHFFIQNRLVLMAEKQLKNRTSNYHIFDMTRAVAVATKLTKKSGNYVGKLRANFARRKFVLIGNLHRRTELGAMLFLPTATPTEPRRLTVALPPLSAKRREIEGLTVGDSSSSFSVLLDLLAAVSGDTGAGSSASDADVDAAVRHSPIPPSALQVFQNKLPVFDNGYYRLNFHGRVSVPSVKNFQLEARGAGPEAPVALQFGKVNDKKFHLDFRAPVTPIQAFALALAQFDF